jgi:uncharacterized protein (DUF488 family)
MRLHTIGYGGRTPDELVRRLVVAGVRTVVDVRLRPDRAHLGCFARARTPDKGPVKGIEKLLAGAGIGYRSLPELGNVFLDLPDWRERYAALLARAGDLLTARLAEIETASCLLCAEKRAAECHRSLLADFLAGRGYEVEHLE